LLVRPGDKVFVLSIITPIEGIGLVQENQEQTKAAVIEKQAVPIQIFKELGVDCEGFIRNGDARLEICTFCLQVYIDFLVMGTRGLSGLKRTISGSVSDYCVRHAPCPVLVVREN
jgi:nucleotide-binding universal stress UspA family protein